MNLTKKQSSENFKSYTERNTMNTTPSPPPPKKKTTKKKQPPRCREALRARKEEALTLCQLAL